MGFVYEDGCMFVVVGVVVVVYVDVCEVGELF